MTPKLKKLLALCLVVLVGVVWVPQILSANAKREPAGRSEVSALGADSARTPSKPASTANQDSGASETHAGADQADLAQALEASVARARFVASEGPRIDLSQLASAWSASTAPPVAVTHPVSAAIDRPQTAATAAPVAELASQPDPIDAFLAAHPLRGTLIGATQRLACLGPLLVSVGDEPVKGLVVSAIEPRFVTFTRAGEVVRTDLIPFQARAPSAVSTTSNAGGAAPAGAAPVAPAPATSAGSELDKLLPLLKQAAGAIAPSSSTDAAKEKQPAPTSGSKDKP